MRSQRTIKVQPSMETDKHEDIEMAPKSTANGIMHEERNVQAASTNAQFRAMFLKNFTLQKRKTVTTCCQLCIPLSVVLVVGILNVIIIAVLPKNPNEGKTIYTDIQDITGYFSYYPYYLYVNETNRDLGTLSQHGSPSGLLGNVSHSYGCLLLGVPCTNESIAALGVFPYFVAVDSMTTLDKRVDVVKQFQAQLFKTDAEQNAQNETTILPIAGVEFLSFNETALSISYKVLYDDQSALTPRARIRQSAAGAPIYNTAYEHQTSNTVVENLLSNAIVKTYLSPLFSITTLIQGMPYVQLPLQIDLAGFLGAFLFPFAFSFLLPVFVHNVVQEKQEKLREMMKMMGMKMATYYVINYIYNFVLYCFITLFVIIIGLIFQLRYFIQTSGAIQFFLFLGWGLNQVSFSFVISTAFSKTRTATIICYLLVIFSVLIGDSLNVSVFGTSTAHPAYFIWPNFAFYRGLYLIGTACNTRCLTTDKMGPGSEWPGIFLALYIEAVFFLFLVGYLDAVLPKEYGVQKPLHFPLLWIWNKLFKRKDEKDDEVILTSPRAKEMSHNFEDSDVADERKKVENIGKSELSKYPILIKNLKKNYKDKVAVVDLCLTIENNECFGLLGPNGAGKTTTISILTGLFMPSEGQAWVGGFGIEDKMDLVHQIMGVCPQFDTLWSELTPKETLLFYARLKGAPRKEDERQAMEYLRQVGLVDAADLKVSELSGGMKRRLSVAVALVGNPRVIFLDEPTTGLDPDSRRALWDVLLEVKKNKCVVLTTHSMEEADILCTRIGIMAHGSLQCLGSNVRLKNKYGEGYSLKVNFAEEDEEVVIAYVKEILPAATVSERFAGNITFGIPTSELVMSQALSSLIGDKERSKIRDWGLSQTTLEDVFLNIVKNH